MLITRTETLTSRRMAGLIERTIIRVFKQHVRVAAVHQLSANFRLIDLQGDDLKRSCWTPGDQVRIHTEPNIATVTYTPANWFQDQGVARIVAFTNADPSRSTWNPRLQAGADFLMSGPRRSVALKEIKRPFLIFGDETSFGLVAALHRTEDRMIGVSPLFEVSSANESNLVLRRLGLADATIIERLPDDLHLDRIARLILYLALDEKSERVVLTGKATSVQRLAHSLRSRGISATSLIVAPHQSSGHEGTDQS